MPSWVAMVDQGVPAWRPPSKLSVLQRRRLLADYESGEYSAAQLMDISGLSRSAMYATLNKAREEHRGSREHR